jgi:hypothetical protein
LPGCSDNKRNQQNSGVLVANQSPVPWIKTQFLDQLQILPVQVPMFENRESMEIPLGSHEESISHPFPTICPIQMGIGQLHTQYMGGIAPRMAKICVFVFKHWIPITDDHNL